jgi:FAD/FMN-containing dehydrogenase
MSDSEFLSFQTAFKGDIVTPGDPDYDQAISRWASNAVRKAKIVAFAKDAEDVSLAITFAKATKLPLAIRGGGHSSSGASSSENGIVIDLSRHLNGVRIDPDKKLAYASGGAVWETVDQAAIEHGLATVGGTVNHVEFFCFGAVRRLDH